MKTTDEIKGLIKPELDSFNKEFHRALKTDIKLLNLITSYMLRRKGKQLRPVLVFLSAKLIAATNESTRAAAILIEILHTATLVHDDVVDDAYERRGFLSINALWKSKLAVLLGDFMFAKGFLLTLEKKEFNLLEIFSEAVKEMSEGEILQIQKTRKLNITEDEYFDIVKKKTATLIAACTASGASSVTNDQSIVAKMKEFGLNLGVAFQIKDDLFDYEKSSIIGKPKGNDIKEKKLTLPLIHSLEQAPISERRKMLKLINKNSSKTSTYNTIFKFVHKYDGQSYAYEKMMTYKNKALLMLESFPVSDIRVGLEKLVEYIVSRKK